MRKSSLIKIFSLAFVILISAVFFSVTSEHPKGTDDNKTLNLYEDSPITSLDVSKITDGVSGNQMMQVGEGLFKLDEKGNPQNALVEKTTVSTDEKTYVFDLNPTAKWSDGTPVTANDFVYSWKRTVNPNTKSEFTYLFENIENAKQIAKGTIKPDKLGVKATAPHQLTVKLATPVSYFKKLLSTVTFYPISKRAVKKYGNQYGSSANKMVYNGPFIVKGWNGVNDRWKLIRNPYFSKTQKGNVEELNFRVIKEPVTAYNLFQTGKLDIVRLNGIETIQNQNNRSLKTATTGRIGFIQYNQREKLLKNQNLRRAISLAIDRKSLTQKVLQNGSTSATSFALSNMLNNPKTGHDFTQDVPADNELMDLKLAQKLFQKAQKETGKNQMSLILTIADDENSEKMASFIQGQLLEKLNLRIKIRKLPFKSMFSTVSNHDFQMNLTSWNVDFLDPTQTLNILKSDSNSNMGGFHDRTFDQLMNQASGGRSLDENQRYQDLLAAAAIIERKQAVTPLYEGKNSILIQKRVKNVIFNITDGTIDYSSLVVK